MAEGCRKGSGHNIAALTAVAETLIALSQQESADVRLASTMAAMEVKAERTSGEFLTKSWQVPGNLFFFPPLLQGSASGKFSELVDVVVAEG